MTEYGFVHSRRIFLSSSTVAEKKEARRKLLEQVEQRRRENYIRWHKKMQLQAASKIDTIALLMNNDEKILKAIEQEGKVLEALQTGQTRLEKTVTSLQADVKSLKTDVSDVKQGQKEQGSAIARLVGRLSRRWPLWRKRDTM